MRGTFLAVIHFYQHLILPLIPLTCHFCPTCPEYAREAIQCHDAFEGLYLGTRHVSKCHPLHKGGFDPVPLEESKSADKHSHKHNH